jgi:hypothetical protein
VNDCGAARPAAPVAAPDSDRDDNQSPAPKYLNDGDNYPIIPIDDRDRGHDHDGEWGGRGGAVRIPVSSPHATPIEIIRNGEIAARDASGCGIVQLKVWLLGISPMVWCRVLMPSEGTLQELHGVMQVTIVWEGFHLYQFCLRAARYV